MVDAPSFEPPGQPKIVTNELTVLADFIGEHSAEPFDRHLSALLSETGSMHDLWAGNCQVTHFYSDVPCDEYERAVSLGIAWLKARIEAGANRAS